MTPQETARHAASIAILAAVLRDMPVATARDFLAGLLPVMADTEPVSKLREAYMALNKSDSQLELLATQQAVLSL